MVVGLKERSAEQEKETMVKNERWIMPSTSSRTDMYI
jgi:hypothetical protein